MKRFLVRLVLVLAVLVPTVAHAQSAVKLGVVDFQQALNEVEEGKRARATLEKRFDEKKAGLEARKAELEQMRDSLEAQKALLSENALRAKEAEFNTKAVEFQQDMVNAQTEMAAMEQELTGGILEKLLNVAQAIGKEQGFTLVVEAQSVVFAVDALDITAQVIARFNTKK